MYKLISVNIKGFWGQYEIDTDFDESVNIFIGKNGTGKTTFINILEAVISVNLEKLYSLQFSSVELKIKQKNSIKKISVIKEVHDSQYRELHYQISNRKYKLPILSDRELRNFSATNGRIHPKIIRETFEIKEELNNLISISFLSVSREKFFQDILTERNQNELYNAIDNRLTQLMSDLTTYQLQLETEVNKLSKKFQEDVLRSMLFDPNFDYVDITKKVEINTDKISNGLTRAYDVLGILDVNTQENIEKHVSALSIAAQKINENVESAQQIPIYPNDVTPLTLIMRTQKIIDLSALLDTNKKRIFDKLDNYINLLNEFHTSKYFTLGDSVKGTIVVLKDGEPLVVSDLSSGEKQLLILLTETLLQREKETLFIADEPELSLHIEWQRKIISSIRQLNPNSQIVLATHSPEIVGKYKGSLINMEQIING